MSLIRSIPLTRGHFAVVDEEDYERLAQFKWNSNRHYARRHGRAPDGSRRYILMHREILGLTSADKVDVDHINGSGFDNRKCNLRICSRTEHSHNNMKNDRTCSSHFKGVSWNKFAKKWCAKIKPSADSKRMHLGYFTDELAAARAYDDAVRRYHGSFGRVNLPD